MLGLYFIIFWLVDFCLACCLDKVETCGKCLLTIDGL